MEWLKFYKRSFFRINEGEKVEIKNIELNDHLRFTIKSKDFELNSEDISAVWFRRGLLQIENYFSFNLDISNVKNMEDSFRHILSANSNFKQELLEYIFIQNPQIRSYGRNYLGRINKFQSLDSAKKVGLKIPKTALLSNKHSLHNFFLENDKNIITKSLDINYWGISELDELNFKVYGQFTSKVREEDILNMPEEFELTIFQENIPKAYEIRTFYWDEKFYSQALFTTLKSKSQIDSRNRDPMNRIRSVPYKLPNVVCNQIKRLMKTLKLETGSIDLIRSKSHEYVFLEVNPRGQYGQLSNTCNYHLEKIVSLQTMFTN